MPLRTRSATFEACDRKTRLSEKSRPASIIFFTEYTPKLLLLDQGILDQPCAPLLCVNEIDDSVFPIADMYLLLEHGDPRSARFYHSGHMGGGNSQSVIVQWLKERLAA